MTARHSSDDVEQLLRSAYVATEDLPQAYRPLRQERRSGLPRWVLPLAVPLVVTGTAVTVTLVAAPNPSTPLNPAGGTVSTSQPTGEASTPRPRDSVTAHPAKGPSQVTSSTAGDYEHQAPLLETIGRINRIAAGQDPAFREAAMDLTARSVTIYRVDTDPARLASIYAATPARGVRLRYAHALLTRTNMNQLLKIYTHQAPQLAARGIKLNCTYSDTPAGPMIIGYDPDATAPTDADLTAFEVFGRGTVTFKPSQGVTSAIGVIKER